MSAEVIVNRTGAWELPGELLERGLKTVLEQEGVGAGELSVTFLDDSRMREMNREYFGRAHPTDVISFALQDPGEPVLGDVYVGYDQALRQAEELSLPLEEELLRLAIHGTLHVLGYDHPEGEGRETSAMFRLQEEYLSRALPGS